MSKPLKGLNVLSKHDPDMFNKILGHKEYKIAIEKADGDAEKLKNIFWNDLADDYHWEFIKGEIVWRSGKSVMAATVKQNLQMLLRGFLKKNKTGEVKMKTQACFISKCRSAELNEVFCTAALAVTGQIKFIFAAT